METIIRKRGELLLIGAKQLTHIDGLNVMFLTLKQILDHVIVAKPDRIRLLNVISTNTPHRLHRFLLCHVFEVLANEPMAKLIVRSVDIIR